MFAVAKKKTLGLAEIQVHSKGSLINAFPNKDILKKREHTLLKYSILDQTSEADIKNYISEFWDIPTCVQDFVHLCFQRQVPEKKLLQHLSI